MSHTIYTTEALVLHRVSTGEADVTLWLLTAELGLVVARAQSARKSTAKMRGHLQLFSAVMISLVRGKYVWRVTGTEQLIGQRPSLDNLALSGEALNAFAHIAIFVRRMTLADSQSTLELFEIVSSAREELIRSDVDVDNLERETIARILISLGYLDTAILNQIERQEIPRNTLAGIVNRAIVESHL